MSIQYGDLTANFDATGIFWLISGLFLMFFAFDA